MEYIKLVVIDEHTLGYILSETPNQAGILHTSVLRGSPLSPSNPVMLQGRTVRLATEADFEIYRVSMTGYKQDPQYLYYENSLS